MERAAAATHRAGGRRNLPSAGVYPDGEDDEVARAYFELLYPAKSDRQIAFERASDTIRQVARENLLSLALTTRRTWHRLNVGAIG